MVKVEFFGLYRLNYKMKECEIDAADVMDLFKKLNEAYPVYSVKDLKNSIVIVNDVNFNNLKNTRPNSATATVYSLCRPRREVRRKYVKCGGYNCQRLRI